MFSIYMSRLAWRGLSVPPQQTTNERRTQHGGRPRPVHKSSCLAFTDWNQMQFVLIVHNRTPNCFRATALPPAGRRSSNGPASRPSADVFCRRTTPLLTIFETATPVNGVTMNEWMMIYRHYERPLLPLDGRSWLKVAVFWMTSSTNPFTVLVNK